MGNQKLAMMTQKLYEEKKIEALEESDFAYQEKEVPSKVFVYNDLKHEYRIEGTKDSRMTGNTTVLSVVNKDALKLWYAKMGLEAVWANRDKLKDMTEKELKAFLIDCVESADNRKDNSASLGKYAHKYCELVDKGMTPNADMEIISLAQNYLFWRANNVKKILFVEKPLFSLKYFVAGTPDRGFLMNDGKALIGDTKFTGGIYDRLYFAQMAGYRMMLEEMATIKGVAVRLEYEDHTENYNSVEDYLNSLGAVKWEGGVIIRQGTPLEDQSDKLWPKREKNYKEDFEVAYSFDYEGDLSIFLSAHNIYKKNKYSAKKLKK